MIAASQGVKLMRDLSIYSFLVYTSRQELTQRVNFSRGLTSETVSHSSLVCEYGGLQLCELSGAALCLRGA